MALSKLAVKRLTTLATFMEKLPASANKHFKMRQWFLHTGDHEHDIGFEVERKDMNHCGTVACALGWAATVPSFRKAGLKLHQTGGSGYVVAKRAPDPFGWGSTPGSR
jgi:hypothetical protein